MDYFTKITVQLLKLSARKQKLTETFPKIESSKNAINETAFSKISKVTWLHLEWLNKIRDFLDLQGPKNLFPINFPNYKSVESDLLLEHLKKTEPNSEIGTLI